MVRTVISTSGPVVFGLGAMWISTNQIGLRIGDLARRMDRLEDEIRTFKDLVLGDCKFQAPRV